MPVIGSWGALYPHNCHEGDPRAPREPLLGRLMLPNRRSKAPQCRDEGVFFPPLWSSRSPSTSSLGPIEPGWGHKLGGHAPKEAHKPLRTASINLVIQSGCNLSLARAPEVGFLHRVEGKKGVFADEKGEVIGFEFALRNHDVEDLPDPGPPGCPQWPLLGAL
jgi:hypothetical protein